MTAPALTLGSRAHLEAASVALHRARGAADRARQRGDRAGELQACDVLRAARSAYAASYNAWHDATDGKGA